MTIWSSLRSVAAYSFKNNLRTHKEIVISGSAGQRLMSGGHGPKVMPITPSRWQWHKFKDLLHFYLMVGLIPVSAIIFYANVFIGPAQLAEIPEGYVPKHWEYHQKMTKPGTLFYNLHPITRFLARYVIQNPQEEYEKYLHYVFEEEEKRQLRFLERKINDLMSERNDYKGYYYRPAIAKYVRRHREEVDKNEASLGDM